MNHEFILWGRVDSGLRSASTFTKHGVVTLNAWPWGDWSVKMNDRVLASSQHEGYSQGASLSEAKAMAVKALDELPEQ